MKAELRKLEAANRCPHTFFALSLSLLCVGTNTRTQGTAGEHHLKHSQHTWTRAQEQEGFDM